MNEQQADKLRNQCSSLVSLYTVSTILSQEIYGVVGRIAKTLEEIAESEHGLDKATCYVCGGDVEDYGGLHIMPDGAKTMCKRCFNRLKESKTQYMKEELKDE